mmetsp:Transcript_7033/g.28986  ORF Transcript_7033/g.28986 Transcript_7033/m.28986 type:complete len:350 (-) Transcript_7033:49-1098(-)
MDWSCSNALPHTARASGSVTSSFAFSSAGMSLGRNGAASSGSSTNLDMLLMITAHMRFVAVERTRNPRRSSGAMSASGAAVTVCTNVVDASFCTHSITSSWSMVAETSAGMNGSTSLLSMDSQILLRHSRAATETSSLESFTICVTTGMTSLSASDVDIGEHCAKTARKLSAPTIVCHFSLGSIASSNEGSTARRPCADIVRANASIAADAAVCVSLLCLSAQHLSKSATSATVWCSAAAFASFATVSITTQAPSRFAAVPLAPSRSASASEVTSPAGKPEGEDLTWEAICDAAVRLASPPSKTPAFNRDMMMFFLWGYVEGLRGVEITRSLRDEREDEDWVASVDGLP